MNRRSFIKNTGVLMAATPVITADDFLSKFKKNKIITVNGELDAAKMGFTLSHEHLLVDFIGADKYDPKRWNHDDVIKVVTPYINEIQELGCKTFVECTPEFIGRDALLMQKISDATGMNILTNTGYYGAAKNKYIPIHAYSENSEQLAERWIKDFEEGISGTDIKPGFIKTGVADITLSKLHQKLISAAAITHNQTGLTIASHTGPAEPALEQIDLLRSHNIAADAFIWVHAQNEKNDDLRIQIAESGAWVSIDGVNEENVSQYVKWLALFKEKKLLDRVLVSHDAGWYSPGEPGGGSFNPFTAIFNNLIPALNEEGFSAKEIEQIFEKNPAEALSIKVRAIN